MIFNKHVFPCKWRQWKLLRHKLYVQWNLGCVTKQLRNQHNRGNACHYIECMSLLPDTYNCGLRMRRECRQPQVSDLDMHHARASRTCRDACWDGWLAVSFEVGGEENVPGIPGACATRNCTYLVRGPWQALVQYDVRVCFDLNNTILSRLVWIDIIGNANSLSANVDVRAHAPK